MKKWKIIDKSLELKTRSQDLGIAEVIEILLKNRGITSKKEIEEFLHPDLSKISINNVEINKTSLKKSIKRIKDAIKNNEKIIIFGDYDVDGICGSAILWEEIYKSYKNVFPYIPSRTEEGYGLSIIGIESVLKIYPDVKLIITVDNGIVAHEATEYANSKNIDVIISDHHATAKKLPKAYSIVHTTKLCGAGVAYLLSKELTKKDKDERDDHLELVALATIADLVPLIGANRTFVFEGLKLLSKTKRPGLKSLFNLAGITKNELGVYEVGYIIGPRLNAMGRLSNAMDSLRLLCTKDFKKASFYATNLNNMNRQRQMLTEQTTIQAKNLKTNFVSKIIFTQHVEYNQGIIGLVASRLVEEYYKPSFVVSIGETYSKGSARSISGVNIIELIRSVPSDLLLDAGGHPMAAGFTILTEKIEEFVKALDRQAKKIITEDLLQRILKIDLVLDFTQITYGLYEKLQIFAPFGMGNPEPVFATENVIINDMNYVGRDKNHLRLKLEKDGIVYDAIAFSFGQDKDLSVGDKIDVAYTIDKDSWNGNSKLQLKVRDIKSSGVL